MNLEEKIKKLSIHQKKELVTTSPIYLDYMDDEDILSVISITYFDINSTLLHQLKSTGRLKNSQIIKKIIKKCPGIMKEFDSFSGELPEDARKSIMNYYIDLRFPENP
jgi:hypothetical protein